ncbi:hypothetical protein F5X68DRAFT_244533 [Plectosphaerella plurivora]|uniref:Uncharacterized protein n=1 Tax=Plectosphaerella plurivora TaxID=936078 RepID=A0A9P8VN76_9PEZI|nr:hypothetical protein F5X68DRAFT_244533 [Plectosphaerella plurivora]
MYNLVGFLRLMPLWITLHVIFSTLVQWKIAYARMALPTVPSWSAPSGRGETAAGTAILAIHFTLLGLFLLSVGTVWAHAIFHAPFYRPFGPEVPFGRRLFAIMAYVPNPGAGSASSRTGRMPIPPRPETRWYQAHWKTASLHLPRNLDTVTLAANMARPNFCTRDPKRGICANGDAGRRDRMYHALPVSVISFLIVCYFAGGWGLRQLNNLGLKNCTMYERKRTNNVWVFVMPTSDNKWWILRRCPFNPWDQGGWYANLRHVMGEGWTWLVPFWQPRRVKDYDDQRPDYDEKYGPEYIKWRNNLRRLDNTEHPDVRRPEEAHPRDRRAEASSSGTHEPAQPSRRRRQQTDDQV